MTPKQQMIADGAPRALFLSQEARRKAWIGRPVTTVAFVKLQRDESAEAKAMREKLKAEEITALKNRLARSKLRKETKAIDYSKMRWDSRRNKFVPLTGDKPNVSAPDQGVSRSGDRPAQTKPTPAAGRRAVAKAVDAPGQGSDWPRISKDTAEALAKLNGVWKPEYEKLRGTGRIVMTVGNVLKGLVKRGGTVKWQ